MASSFVLECIILMNVLVLSWQQDAVYFSSGPDIRRLELSSTSQVSISVSGLSHAGAIDYDVLENKIYWIDQEQRAIKSISHPSSDGSQSQTVTSLDLSDPTGLAVDPVGRNVYVCDKDQRRITIITADGEHRRVIVWRDMYSPVSVQLDVLEGYMFWLDSGSGSVPPRVERSSLDGTERRVLVNLTSGAYVDLAVDPVQKRVYWTTKVNGVSKIESCLYNGSELTTVREGSALQFRPHALSVWNGTMYWSQLNSTDTPGAIYSSSVSTPQLLSTTLYSSPSLSPYDIALSVDASFLPETHRCRVNNGGCPKICLPLSSNQPVCVCDSGQSYNEGKCSSYYGDVVFVGYDDQLRVLVPQEDESFLDFQFPVQIGNVSSVAVYSEEHYVFWVEYGVDPFQLARLRRATVVDNTPTVEDVLPLGWMVEPKLIIGRHYLYWVDVALKTIGVTDLDGKFPKILIDSGLQSPRGLVLDRESRKLYWVNVNTSGSYIECANENGTGRSVPLALKPNSEPFAMTIKEHDSGSTLFWIDRGLSQVGMLMISDAPTEEEVVFDLSSEDHYTAIAYHYNTQLMRDCLLLTSHSGEVVQYCDGSEDLVTVYSGLSGKAHAITATSMEHSSFFPESGVCRPEDCQQLCFPDPAPNREYCSCVEGYHLDGKDCIVNWPYFLVGGVGRVYILNASLPGSHLHSELELPSYNLTEISTHYRSQLIVWLDFNRSRIYKSRIKSYIRRSNPIELVGSPEVVAHVNSSCVGDIDVDWLGQNVYWSVPEDGRIDYASINNGGHLVFMSGLNRPTQLAIDGRNRTLYWTGKDDRGVTTIYKCLFSGCIEPEVVLSLDSDSEITGFTLNVNKWYLVWSVHKGDGRNNVHYLVLSADNPSPVQIHANITSVLSLDAVSHFVYILESGEKQQVKILLQNGGVADTDNLPEGSVYHDIELLGPLAQPGEHVCGRGECSHICAALEDRFECRCPLGMKLDETGRVCVEFIKTGEFVFVATKTSVLLGPYDDREREISRDNLQMVPYSGEDIQFIQYDPVNQELFIADHGKGWVIALDLTTWTQRIIDKPSYSIPDWTSFHYDYLGGTLYWSFGTNVIEAASRLGGERVHVFHKDSNTRTMIKNIAVDSHRSTLYWIGETPHYTANKDFIKVDLSLSNTSMVNHYFGEIRRPYSLVLGALGDQLFWIDLAFKSIRCYNLSSDKTEDCVENLEFNSSTILRVSGNYIYWYNDSNQSVMRARTSGNDPQPVLTECADLRDIYIGERDYLLGGGVLPCFQPDPVCEFWCASTDAIERDYNCLCPHNYRREVDPQKCKPLGCKPWEFSCAKSNECVPGNYFCNGHRDCSDGSDEKPYRATCLCGEDQVECKLMTNGKECIEKDTRCDQQNKEKCKNFEVWNCLECNIVNETMCADREKCIRNDYVCDGHEDCKDKSDETNCSVTSRPSTITTHVPSTGDNMAIIATAVCLISATLLVIAFLLFLIVKYCRSRTASKSRHSQNGSAVRLTSSTAMSTSSTVQYGETSDISSYVTNTDVTKDTNVSMITDPDLFNKFGLTRHLSDVSVETIVTTDPIVSSDPPPSPVTVKSEAILPSIEPSTGFDQDTVCLRAPAPSVNLSCYSDFDRFSSVSEQAKHNVRPITISTGKKRIHFHVTQEPNYPEYCPPPSEVMSMASNSHCTPPPPPSPVTLRSTIDVIHEQDYTSSSTMV